MIRTASLYPPLFEASICPASILTSALAASPFATATGRPKASQSCSDVGLAVRRSRAERCWLRTTKAPEDLENQEDWTSSHSLGISYREVFAWRYLGWFCNIWIPVVWLPPNAWGEKVYVGIWVHGYLYGMSGGDKWKEGNKLSVASSHFRGQMFARVVYIHRMNK